MLGYRRGGARGKSPHTLLRCYATTHTAHTMVKYKYTNSSLFLFLRIEFRDDDSIVNFFCQNIFLLLSSSGPGPGQVQVRSRSGPRSGQEGPRSQD